MSVIKYKDNTTYTPITFFMDNKPTEGSTRPVSIGGTKDVIDERVSKIIRPNYLTNANFSINNKGWGASNAPDYTMEGWRLEGTNTKIACLYTGYNWNGIYVFDNGEHPTPIYLSQFLNQTDVNRLKGQMITISALAYNFLNSSYELIEISSVWTGSTLQAIGNGWRIVLNQESNPKFSFVLTTFMNASNDPKLVFSAAKLEIGKGQTLAHQDSNGNWVLNEIPNKEIENVKTRLFDNATSLGSSKDIYLGQNIYPQFRGDSGINNIHTNDSNIKDGIVITY